MLESRVIPEIGSIGEGYLVLSELSDCGSGGGLDASLLSLAPDEVLFEYILITRLASWSEMVASRSMGQYSAIKDHR